MAKGNRTNPQARPESSDQRRNGQRTPRPEKIDYPGLKSAAGEDVRLTHAPTVPLTLSTMDDTERRVSHLRRADAVDEA